MKKINLILLALSGLFLLLSCEDKEDNIDCVDHEFYMSFSVNGSNYCLPDAHGSIFKPYGDVTKYRTTAIASKELYTKNEVTYLFPVFSISFPDKVLGVYNNHDIDEKLFSAYFDFEKGEFEFPSEFYNHENEYFELTVTEFDTENCRVSGTFHGIIFSKVNENDSIIIENGQFVSQLNNCAK